MGHHNIHYYGDPNALNGKWSPPNSKANFCEEDYAVTAYLAEFINSLTNLAYTYYALRYMYGPGSRGLFRPKLDFMSVSLFMLGIGSFLFHATMRQTMQFADELAMLGLTWSLLLGALNNTSAQFRACLAVAFPLFSAFYVYTGNILYHTIAFGTILFVITLRGTYVFHWRVPGFPPEKLADWRVRGRNALIYLLVGYALWNIDLEFCAQLRALRSKMGLPWSWITELHGWWHVLTAISANLAMDVSREVTAELLVIEAKKAEGSNEDSKKSK